MFKHVAFFISYIVAVIFMYIVLLFIVIIMIGRGLLWDFRFKMANDMKLRDVDSGVLDLPRDIWEDVYDWFYKTNKYSGGC